MVLRDVSFSQYSHKSVRLKNDIYDKSNYEIKIVIQIIPMWLSKLIRDLLYAFRRTILKQDFEMGFFCIVLFYYLLSNEPEYIYFHLINFWQVCLKQQLNVLPKKWRSNPLIFFQLPFHLLKLKFIKKIFKNDYLS